MEQLEEGRPRSPGRSVGLSQALEEAVVVLCSGASINRTTVDAKRIPQEVARDPELARAAVAASLGAVHGVHVVPQQGPVRVLRRAYSQNPLFLVAKPSPLGFRTRNPDGRRTQAERRLES